jgi:RNA polymerase sigma factor (sigma-70 family)
MEPALISPPADGPRRPLRRSPVPQRMRSDEELVRRFRAGDEDAFRVIHDRYRARLFAYTRHMLRSSRQDAEEALQDVFIRAHVALRTDARDVSLRAWLYRIAHNRCIDELRRPEPPSPESLALLQPPPEDPIAVIYRRESLRRLVADIGRLPEQQRAALLMRELGGMSYDEVAAALTITVPSVKSTLTRARMSLTTAAVARDATCAEIRAQVASARERGVRFDGLVRRHLHDCDACRAYRRELQATSRRLAALTPALAPGALLAKLLGGASLLGGGAGAATSIGGGAAAGGGLLALTNGQLAALAAAGAIGIGGGVVALDGGSHASPHPPPAPRVRAAARSTSVAPAKAPRAKAAPRSPRGPRHVGAVGQPRARRAWATPRYASLRKQLAQIQAFHLVWRDGALEPVGLARAPRDSQAREVWIASAASAWLVESVEGRRLLTHMPHLPDGVDVTIDANGSYSLQPSRAARTTNATVMAASIWLTATPQGRRALQRLRELARPRTSPQPPPPPTTTSTAPAPTTPQPPPAPATTTDPVAAPVAP